MPTEMVISQSQRQQNSFNKLCGRPPQYAPPTGSVLDLGPICIRDRQTSDAYHRLMPPTLGAGA